jgi:circadian clock protein KaiB
MHADGDIYTSGEEEIWLLRLYVNGQMLKTRELVDAVETLLRTHLGAAYALEVIDLSADPERGAADRVLALPTLVRKLPSPSRKIVGDLHNLDHLRTALNLPSVPSGAA